MNYSYLNKLFYGLIFWTFIVSVLAAQADPERVIMVPFNDHGKWGYCDTLGTLMIKSHYQAASLFYLRTIGLREENIAEVETRFGKNIVNASGQLLFPKKSNVQYPVSLASTKGEAYLVERKGRIGIYLPQEGWFVKPSYDSLAWLAHHQGVLLVKIAGQPTYDIIDRATGEIQSSDIISVDEYMNNSGHILTIANRVDGTFYRLSDGQLTTFTAQELANYDRIAGEVADIYDEIEDDYRPPNRLNPSTFKVDRIVDSKDFSGQPQAAKYGFQQLIIAERDGRTGVVNEKGQDILPFEYDDIQFRNYGAQAQLYKDGKQGRKLFFTHYPTIEAKYDKLSPGPQLRVTRTWSFGLFWVEIDGEKAYVGENGVEYFDLD